MRSKLTVALAGAALLACTIASIALVLVGRLSLESRARQIMEEIGISESRRVRGLGTNQIAALIERFAR